MTNAQDDADAGCDTAHATTAQAIGAKLSAMMVARRLKSYVGAALNGGAKACSDARAAHVRSEMQRDGGSPHWEGILALDFCDLADGVPVEMILAAHYFAIEAVKARAPKLRVDRPLGALAAMETKAQGRLDVAQLHLVANDTDPAAIEAALTAADSYAAPFEEFRATLRERLVVMRTSAREFVGRRRGLALHGTRGW